MDYELTKEHSFALPLNDAYELEVFRWKLKGEICWCISVELNGKTELTSTDVREMLNYGDRIKQVVSRTHTVLSDSFFTDYSIYVALSEEDRVKANIATTEKELLDFISKCRRDIQDCKQKISDAEDKILKLREINL